MIKAEPTPLIITRVVDQGRDIRSFDLMPAAANDSHGVEFTPGQVAMLSVNRQEPAYFAFASAPEDRELEILIKRTVGVSLTIFELRAGDRIDLFGVTGHGFDLGRQRGQDLVLVAMGTGVAPLRSVLRHVLSRKENFGKLVVLSGARPIISVTATRRKAGKMRGLNCVR